MQFTIIIPVYNGENCIEQCIQSIIMQEYKDFEILIIDDGSTDNTYEVCKKYDVDERVKIFRKENGGVTSARKYACKKANGEYIICVDCDDYIESGYLACLHDILQNNPTDVLVLSYYEKVQNQLSVRKSNIDTGLYRGKEKNIAISEYLYDRKRKWVNSGSIVFSLWCKVFKRELFVTCQLAIDNNLVWGEDLLLTYKALVQCDSFYVSDCCGYVYVVNNQSVTHSYSNDSINKISSIVTALLEEIPNDNRVPVYALENLLGQIGYAACSATNYQEFKAALKRMKQYERLWDCANKAKITNYKIADFIKVILLKRKFYWPLFCAYRIIGKHI